MAQDRSPESSSDHVFYKVGQRCLFLLKGHDDLKKKIVFISQHKHPSKLKNRFPYISLCKIYDPWGRGNSNPRDII